MKSDPDHRLVTGELERRWEVSLRQLKSAEEELKRLHKVGPRLPELWHAKLLSDAQKKALLRSLIENVEIHRLAPDQVQTRVVWRGGTTTTDVVRVSVGKLAWLSDAAEMEATIKRMTEEGHSDAAIAEHLTTAGHRSPRADKVLESTVRLTGLRLGILRKNHQSHPRRIEGFLTIPQLAKKFGGVTSVDWRSHPQWDDQGEEGREEEMLSLSRHASDAGLKPLIAEYPSKVGCGR